MEANPKKSLRQRALNLYELMRDSDGSKAAQDAKAVAQGYMEALIELRLLSKAECYIILHHCHEEVFDEGLRERISRLFGRQATMNDPLYLQTCREDYLLAYEHAWLAFLEDSTNPYGGYLHRSVNSFRELCSTKKLAVERFIYSPDGFQKSKMGAGKEPFWDVFFDTIGSAISSADPDEDRRPAEHFLFNWYRWVLNKRAGRSLNMKGAAPQHGIEFWAACMALESLEKFSVVLASQSDSSSTEG